MKHINYFILITIPSQEKKIARNSIKISIEKNIRRRDDKTQQKIIQRNE